jgi:hypothetical protein
MKPEIEASLPVGSRSCQQVNKDVNQQSRRSRDRVTGRDATSSRKSVRCVASENVKDLAAPT